MSMLLGGRLVVVAILRVMMLLVASDLKSVREFCCCGMLQFLQLMQRCHRPSEGELAQQRCMLMIIRLSSISIT